MELAPYNPSFLDMRNAILVADTSLFQGRQRAQIWRVFASRGMGFFAGSLGGNDSSPSASFETPPTNLTRRHRSRARSRTPTAAPPSPDLPVTLAFQGSGPVNPTAVTGPDGVHYTSPSRTAATTSCRSWAMATPTRRT